MCYLYSVFNMISTLSLLVFGILTDNSDGSLSPDYFALFANWFNRRSNLHNLHSFQKSPTDWYYHKKNQLSKTFFIL